MMLVRLIFGGCAEGAAWTWKGMGSAREAPGQHQAREELPVVHHAFGPS